MDYKHISLQPISGSLGAIVSGVDLREPLTNGVYAEIKHALLANLVIFFRDQDITPDQQTAFARKFGELHIHPFIPSLPGHDEILQLKAESGNNPYLRLSNSWHPDLSYTLDPPLGAILRGVTIPSRGGDTMWVNLYKAYDTLSEKMKVIIADLVAYHDLTKTYRPEDLRTKAGAERYASTYQNSPPAEQPLVQVHPETGKKLLYLSELTTTSIKGLHPRESDAILKMLFEHLDWKELHCRFFWETDSIAMWDNRCTCHYAVRDYDEPREMHRVTMIGKAFN
ncbi:MAG: TauD/TfdA family dioxygenase [Gammaproteobacteria bacterium]|nr:TauD/TfdA family dioxygenase [Gammaproteobacteria bacterium]